MAQNEIHGQSDLIPSARILLAEDDDPIREFVRRGLQHVGYAVTAVADGHEALEALTKQEFDLLLTDIVMPGMDGIALALKANKEYPDMKILMITGYSHEQQRAHNLDFLAHEVLPKPFTLKQICDMVAKVLEG